MPAPVPSVRMETAPSGSKATWILSSLFLVLGCGPLEGEVGEPPPSGPFGFSTPAGAMLPAASPGSASLSGASGSTCAEGCRAKGGVCEFDACSERSCTAACRLETNTRTQSCTTRCGGLQCVDARVRYACTATTAVYTTPTAACGSEVPPLTIQTRSGSSCTFERTECLCLE